MKCLAIPADAGRQVGSISLGGSVFVEASFDAPVMGEVETAPGLVLKVGCLRACGVAEQKTPSTVEVRAAFRQRFMVRVGRGVEPKGGSGSGHRYITKKVSAGDR
nr:hypothetical protein [Granulicella sp. S156]